MRPAGAAAPAEVEAPRLSAVLREVVSPDARLKELYAGAPWSEGPAWWRGSLFFSDQLCRRVLRWHPDGSVGTLVDPADFPNGHAVTPDGRLVQCEHARRAITEVHADGSTTVLVRHHDGRRLNSPNDVTTSRDGSIWFTDPTFGITDPTQGYPAVPEQQHTSVYRLRPGGAAEPMAELDQPNGLAFSPDESLLYVSQTPPGGDARIDVFDHDAATGRLSGRRTFARVPQGIPDGFLVDAAGRLWTSATGAVHVYGPDGSRLGHVPVPGTASNLALDDTGRRLFITGDRLWGLALDGGSVVGSDPAVAH